MKIGELSRLTNVSTRAIRHYEEKGLLMSERLENDYRDFSEIPGWDQPGTFHSVDLWFFFETLAKCWRPFTGKHYDLARQMCNYLSHFIATGDPNGPDSTGKPLPYWIPASTHQPYRMEFGEQAGLQRAEPGPVLELVIEQYFKKQNEPVV